MGDLFRSLETHLRDPFSEDELKAHNLIDILVMFLEQKPIDGMRCHEIARAVQRCTKFPLILQDGFVGAMDGRFGGIRHTWFWTKPFPAEDATALAAWDGNILDPWCMGAHPRVQLLSGRFHLGQIGFRYRPRSEPFSDINDELTDRIECFLKEEFEACRAKYERK